MYTYKDSTGFYFGQTLDGYPHGKGKKVYNMIGVSFEGEWIKGRKHGRGILVSKNFTLDLEFKDNLPVKVMNLNMSGEIPSFINTLHIPFHSISCGNYYYEILDIQNPLIVYFYCGNNAKVLFDGNIFTTQLKNPKLFVSNMFKYVGETKDSECFGYCQIETDYFTYTGFNKYLILEGKGTKVYKNGKIFRGEFKDNELNGECEILHAGKAIKGNFIKNLPNGDLLITLNGITEKIKFSISDSVVEILFKSANSRLNYQQLIDEIKLLMNCEFDYYLKYKSGKVSCTSISKITNRIAYKENSDISFKSIKGLKNWREYEKKEKGDQSELVGVLDEEVGIYCGEFRDGVKHGRGKMIFKNKEVYNGEWKNGIIEGFGKRYYNNGFYYIGSFANGMRNGFGKLFSKGFTYTGLWKNDIYYRKGRLQFSSKEINGVFNDENLEFGLFHFSSSSSFYY